MKVTCLSQSINDLIEIADYFAKNGLEAAERFFDSFEETIEGIRLTPKIGSIRYSEEYGEIRMWFVSSFEKVLIFYRHLGQRYWCCE